VDDDVGDGRFGMLARAVVELAGAPDIIALQEVQDDDGAEISDVVNASQTYARLARAIRKVGGPDYRWADIPPGQGADGGQPGGNIRNAYLFHPERIELVAGTLRRLGDDSPAYEGSRKPLVARFRLRSSGGELAIINVHLASKRHQNGLFAPESPGHDPKEPTRIRQAEIIREETLRLARDGHDYYVTGDFNDFEFSPTLKALLGEESVNLVETVPEEGRYDYNHRGISQVLMHGIVSAAHAARDGVDYEILHGNELIGTKPGEMGDRPTDHAYVLAQLSLRARGVPKLQRPSA
jgi:predicted extracellular nuclease